ncbi:HET-domain-containing protein [Lojkania enalia]|uniref:HET-domain-containing protein n=1 Tax=Lojkania enalia TaxID=147567 RepID=A0A9P4N622_9PLEO|nr:HET-domain-containing protein [Didymosphaeria enalia]
MLCKFCEGFRRTVDLSEAQEVQLHDSFDALRANSEARCHLCRMIHTDLHNQHESEKIEGSSLVIAKVVPYKGFIVSFREQSTMGTGDGVGKPNMADVKVIVEQLSVPRRIETTFQELQDVEDSHTGSASACRAALTWLAECTDGHPVCDTPNALDASLPNRIIDVGDYNDSEEPRLVENKGNMTGGYVALSHCWGGSSHIRTTVANLPHHKSEIKLATLPKTFFDAVHATRELRIRYLWIDSLCIVQDDPADWEKEAALMGKYYSNSLITISAAHGRNSEAGIFHQRDYLSTRPCQMSLRYNGNWRLAYAYARDTSFQISKSSMSGLKEPLPLYSRAWVLQEQVLPPRTLTYTTRGVYWRCQAMRFDERAPLAMSISDLLRDKPSNLGTFKGDPREIESTIAELQRNWIFHNHNAHFTQASKAPKPFHRNGCGGDHFIQDWGRLVHDYTSRGMTRQSDKLVAIAGIANIVSENRSIEYTAGIWSTSKDSIALGLLWSASKPGRRLLDVAPSWSWASIEEEVMWPGHLSVNLWQTAQFLRFESSGTVARSRGEITLRTNVRLGIVSTAGKVEIAKWPEIGNDGALPSFGDSGMSTGITPHWKQGVISLDEALQPLQLVYLVELAIGKINANRKDWLVHALAVINAEGKPGKLRRVGFSTWHQGVWNSPVESLALDATTSSDNSRVDGTERDMTLKLREMGVTIV